jgi:hypothetical protein
MSLALEFLPNTATEIGVGAGPAAPVHLDEAIDFRLSHLSLRINLSVEKIVHGHSAPLRFGSNQSVANDFVKLLSSQIVHLRVELGELSSDSPVEFTRRNGRVIDNGNDGIG